MLNNLRPRLPSWFVRVWPIALVGVFLLAGVAVAGSRIAFFEPKVISPTAPALGVTVISNTKPLTIIFSHPVKEDALRYAVYPDLAGQWRVSTDWLAGRSTLTFTPSVSPDLNTRYTVELNGIQKILGGKSKKYLLSFQTAAIPVVQSALPANQAIDVLPDAPIVLQLNQPLTDSIVLTPVVSPEVTLDPPIVADNTVTFKHQAQFQKGTTYTFVVYLNTVKVNYVTKTKTISEARTEAFSSSFTTIAAPGIESYSPTGTGVDAATTVRFIFKQAMDRPTTEAAVSLSPAAAGTFSWENDQTLIFTPTQPLVKDQAYTVTVASTAKAISGFTLDEPFTFSFTTIGAVKVTAWSPVNGASGVDTTTAVSATFNQEVDRASAESHFSLAPAVDGTFSWNGNTLTFKPAAALTFNQKYTATVTAGVKTVKGLDSSGDAAAAFTTRNQSVMLNVPAYLQAHVYSCMIAAARSALAFRGVNVSESNIISKVGRDSTAWSGTWGGDNGVWGDPDSAIVGPLDNGAATSPAGKQTTNVYWGYGSHWGPIAVALTAYGVSHEIRRGMTVQELAQAITDGNPVIIWWVNGIWPSYEVNWKTPSGKSIKGVNGLHVQVVRGFTGSVDNPVSFTVTDSGYGYPGRSYDLGTFKAKWGWFANTGIIVK